MRRLSFVLLVGCASLPLYGSGMLVSPTQLGLTGKPGSVVTGLIRVSSSRTEKNQIRANIRDFMRDEDNILRVVPAAHPRSARDWLEIDQSSFDTSATGFTEVHVTARIPKEAKGSYWAVAEFSAAPARRTAANGVAIYVVPMVDIPVIVTVQGTEDYKLTIGQFTAVQRAGEEFVECMTIVENSGNSAVLLSGAFTLERSVGGATEEVAVYNISALTSLPGARLNVRGRIPWKGPTSGLQAHSYLRYGARPEDAAEAAATITPEPAAAQAPPKTGT